MSTREQLVNALGEISDSVWNSTQYPVLLSNLPPLLIEKLPDFREALGAKTLKQFIADSVASGKYKLIEHPAHRAKLALLPADALFDFGDVTNEKEQQAKPERSGEKALVEFLKALKRLPPSDLASVQIPVSVLVKFLK